MPVPSIDVSRHSFGLEKTKRLKASKKGNHLVSTGKKALGAPTDRPLDRRTGVGRVDVIPQVTITTRWQRASSCTESTGALSPAVILLLKALAIQV